MIQTCMFMQGLHTSKTDLIHTLIWQGLQHHQHRTSFTVTYCTSNTWYLLHTRPVAHERPVRRDTDLCSIAHLMRTVNVADILGVPSPLCVHECHVPGSEIWNPLAFSMKDWHQNARYWKQACCKSENVSIYRPFCALFGLEHLCVGSVKGLKGMINDIEDPPLSCVLLLGDTCIAGYTLM